MGYSALHLGPTDALRVTVIPHPAASLLSLVAGTFGNRPHKIPRAWQRLLASAAPPGTEEVLRPLFSPAFSVIPDCLTPTAGMLQGDAASYLERLGDLPGETLLAELETDFTTGVPIQWRPVIHRPRRWITAHARLMQILWREIEPLWRRAHPLIQRETERIAVAAMYERLDTVLACLSPRYRYTLDTLHLPDPQAQDFHLGDRRLTLVPLVSGPGASLFAFDRPDFVWIGYPLPTLDRLLTSSGSATEPYRDPLRLLIGPLRAAVLRIAPTRPTMRELASHLHVTPATATYHCVHLETTGLLHRLRHGREVRIQLTPLGEHLIDLLA
ncbi:hypothetical protein [Streptomyces mayteni]